ncbi:MAG: ABC transporter ATP-binding protein [Alicyclobacillaceae bacterium]|nr:ABC transporter ATP-binding protein [Alicyclobacillaceae bacterium]
MHHNEGGTGAGQNLPESPAVSERHGNVTAGIAVAVEGLALSYGQRVALHDVTFSVRAGTCFGLLGPNGAGKSTTLKILCGLVQPDKGSVRWFEAADGHPQPGEADRGPGVAGSGLTHRRIGYVPQEVTLYDRLTARDNLLMFGSLCGLRGRALEARIREVLELVGLGDRAQEPVVSYSGGMRRRLNIAAALLHQPPLVLMDEPTVGVDPQSRHHILSLVRRMTSSGVTVIYCTHYMEEAEAVCDDVAILDHGRVIAAGPLPELLARHAEPKVYLELEAPSVSPPVLFGPVSPHSDSSEAATLSETATAASAAAPVPSGAGWLYAVEGRDVLGVVEALARTCRAQGLAVRRLETVRPTLESVFLALTGTSLRDEA